MADALNELADGGDFADALIVGAARQRGCGKLASFDRELGQSYQGFVERPG